MGEASTLQTLVPGLVILVAVAVLSRLAVGPIPGVSPLIVAIGVGALVANTLGVPAWARPGLERHKLLLETGIVLLGARLTLEELIATGPTVVGLAAGVIIIGILFTELVTGRLLNVGGRITSLLAAGASICGVSAVLAVAGSIDVDETEITYAVATILLFDTVTLIVYPVLGDLLGITGKQFGVWTGLSLFSTGPTAAVGFAVSEAAGQWATITKLVRNSFIGLLAIGYAIRYTAVTSESTGIAEIWSRFPKFLFGFLFVVLIANGLSLSPSTVTSINVTSGWLFTLAFAGLGFDIEISALKATGIWPVALVFIHLLVISVISLAAVLLFL